jgi:hypothetical protein
MFLGVLDPHPDPLVRSTDPDPHPDLYQNVTDGSEDPDPHPHPDLYQNVTDPQDLSDQNRTTVYGPPSDFVKHWLFKYK